MSRWSWENRKHLSLHTSPECQSDHLANSSAAPPGPGLARVPFATRSHASCAWEGLGNGVGMVVLFSPSWS